MGGIISLVVEAEKVDPKAAIDPLTKTPKWKTVKIVKRKITGKADLQQAQNIGKDLFGIIGPDTQDELVGFLKDGLKKWKKDLDNYSILANTGKYPGKKEIKNTLSVTNNLLSIHDAFEFIKSFIENRDKLLDAGEDYQDLKDFHTNQIKTWDELLKAKTEFDPNQADLEKEPETAKRLKRMNEILSSPAPYAMLREVGSLIAGVKKVNDELVAKSKTSATSEIDKIIGSVKKLLGEKQADDDLKNKALYPLQGVKKKIQTDYSIPHIVYRVNEAKEQYEAAVDLVEESIPDKDIKKIQTISPSTLSTKTYLENEQDVDEFLSTFRGALIAALKSDKKIRIV